MNPFVGSSRILEVINIAQMYKCRPSALVGLEEPYEAFCFDEACAFIFAQIENGEQPRFKKKYSSFKDMYKGLEQERG